MKDSITKTSGPYDSTSRGWEKAVKHRTQKTRRQAGRAEIREALDETRDNRTIPCGGAEVIDLKKREEDELRKLWEDIEEMQAPRPQSAWEKEYWRDVRNGLWD